MVFPSRCAARPLPSAPAARRLGRSAGLLLAAGLLMGLGAWPTAAAAAPGEPAGPSLSNPVGGERLGTTGIVVGPGAPALPDVKAEAWLVADLDSGEVLAAKDPHGQHLPASTIKTLTALALIPRVDRDRLVTASYDDVAVEGSRVGLVEDVAYPARDLFSALLMVSGNDAANVLASAVGGQQSAAALMNERARELGALDTLAVNQHGLDAPGQVTSPYDLALIARAGLANPDFAKYVTTRQTSITAPGGTTMQITNKNRLLRDYEGALGIKNGYTNAARGSFVGAAERDGRRLVVTLMKSDPQVFDQATLLLDWGFAATGAQPVGVLVQPEGPVAVVEPVTPAGAALSPGDGARAGVGVREDSGRAQAAPGRMATGTSTSAATVAVTESDGSAPDSGASLPAALGGLALVAGALATVRHSPGGPGRFAPALVAPALVAPAPVAPAPVAPAPGPAPVPAPRPVRVVAPARYRPAEVAPGELDRVASSG